MHAKIRLPFIIHSVLNDPSIIDQCSLNRDINVGSDVSINDLVLTF